MTLGAEPTGPAPDPKAGYSARSFRGLARCALQAACRLALTAVNLASAAKTPRAPIEFTAQVQG